jgi:hypothetical protein
MKKIILTQPIFTPSTKTVDTRIDSFDIRKLYAIINQTTGALIYSTGTPGRGFVNTQASTITLEYDTTAMNATDILQIIYDDSADTEWLQNIYEAVDLLGFLAGVKGPSANLRVTVTDGTVGTVNALGNIVSVGAIAANPQVPSTINIGAIQSNINNIQVNIS